MEIKKKYIIGISVCVLLIVSVFFIFNQGKSNEQVVTEYFEFLKKRDYKQMYQMLDQKTVYNLHRSTLLKNIKKSMMI